MRRMQLLLETELGDQRQMVRCNERRAAAMDAEGFQRQRPVVVEVVEMEQRQNAGIGAGIARVCPRLDGLKLGAHQARSKTARPLVKVAKHDAGAGVLGAFQYSICEQLARLLTTLYEAGAEMHIEDVQK